MHKLIVQSTEDGSSTLFNKELDEHYHSMKGALTEAKHIYRDCAFLYRANKPKVVDNNDNRLTILEVGFGTGLNAVITAMATNEFHSVHYISLEKYPIETQLLNRLDYEQIINGQLYTAIHDAPWEVAIPITPHFTIEKRQCDFLTTPLPCGIDVVYFDAFAPEKQPEMWSSERFIQLYEAMSPHAVLTTYCAKGSIRRMLQSTGFIVERLAGPAGGKREILRATKG